MTDVRRLALKVVHPEVQNIPANYRYIFLYGGRGGGKSFTAAALVVTWALAFPGCKIAIGRRYRPALMMTSVDMLKQILDQYGIQYYHEVSKDRIVITVYFEHTLSVSTILILPFFMGGENKVNEKIKSLSVDFVWLEEATEYRESEFLEYDAILRGNKGKRQLVMTFNPPPTRKHWIYSVYERKKDISYRVHFRVEDNPYLPPDYVETLRDLRHKNTGLWKRYYVGEWGVETVENLIYTNWKTEEVKPEKIKEWYAGIDWGYNNPSVFLLLGNDGDGNIYVLDEIYKTGLVIDQFGEEIRGLLGRWSKRIEDVSLMTIPMFYDPSGRGNAEYLRRKYGYRLIPAESSVFDGITHVQSKNLTIDPRCVNTIKEIEGYSWERDRDDNPLDRPVKFNDHAMDALRYGVVTLDKQKGKVDIFVI